MPLQLPESEIGVLGRKGGLRRGDDDDDDDDDDHDA